MNEKCRNIIFKTSLEIYTEYRNMNKAADIFDKNFMNGFTKFACLKKPIMTRSIEALEEGYQEK